MVAEGLGKSDFFSTGGSVVVVNDNAVMECGTNVFNTRWSTVKGSKIAVVCW